jgi:hypothetical protein
MLAVQYKIADALYPLFVDDPSMFLYPANGGGGPSRVTAISGAFRPFGAFNASAPSPSSLPAPPGGNWDRPGDYLNRASTSQGKFRHNLGGRGEHYESKPFSPSAKKTYFFLGLPSSADPPTCPPTSFTIVILPFFPCV